MVIRMLRIRFVLMSVVALLALTASATIVAPVAGAASAHSSKAKAKAKGKKKKKKKKKAKAPAKKVANVKVTGGSETLLFNSTTVAALEKAKVTVTPGGTASGTLAGGLVFQVKSGTLNPGTGFGSVSATGGVTMASSFNYGFFSSEKSASFSEPAVKLAASAASLSFTSANFTPPVFVFGTLGLKGIKPTSHAGGVTIAKIPVSLASGGVSFLGSFATGFTVGEVVGTLTIEAT